MSSSTTETADTVVLELAWNEANEDNHCDQIETAL